MDEFMNTKRISFYIHTPTHPRVKDVMDSLSTLTMINFLKTLEHISGVAGCTSGGSQGHPNGPGWFRLDLLHLLLSLTRIHGLLLSPKLNSSVEVLQLTVDFLHQGIICPPNTQI